MQHPMEPRMAQSTVPITSCFFQNNFFSAIRPHERVPPSSDAFADDGDFMGLVKA
ncbi:MAG: hypothetical protein A4E48_01108 [Methanosaeta sp. PtaU1.Bin060]|nr:MAG: hypothetical protein A4E48_01108 [Methanosaeta sp. PtaU1.Bin060]